MPLKDNAPPFSYTKNILRMIRGLAAAGCSIETIAGSIGRDKRLFEMDFKRVDAVRYAYEEGKETGIASVSQNLFKKASAKEASAEVMFKWLEYRSRKNWQKVERHEHSGPDGAPIETSHETPEEREARQARIKAGLAELKDLDE